MSISKKNKIFDYLPIELQQKIYEYVPMKDEFNICIQEMKFRKEFKNCINQMIEYTPSEYRPYGAGCFSKFHEYSVYHNNYTPKTNNKYFPRWLLEQKLKWYLQMNYMDEDDETDDESETDEE